MTNEEVGVISQGLFYPNWVVSACAKCTAPKTVLEPARSASKSGDGDAESSLQVHLHHKESTYWSSPEATSIFWGKWRKGEEALKRSKQIKHHPYDLSSYTGRAFQLLMWNERLLAWKGWKSSVLVPWLLESYWEYSSSENYALCSASADPWKRPSAEHVFCWTARISRTVCHLHKKGSIEYASPMHQGR